MRPLILALSTLNPPNQMLQSDIGDRMIQMFSLEGERAETLRNIYANSAIHSRYSVIDDFFKGREEWTFWGKSYPHSIPGMLQRNEFYKEKAPQLSHAASLIALRDWAGNPRDITHVISVSCTGVLAPGLEFRLIESLNLNRSVNRLGINFMGCFGAFKGLQVAAALAKEDTSHRILLVCTELCSLHLQANPSLDTMVANSLFSDGIAAAIIGCQVRSHESPLFSIAKQESLALDNTMDKMTWEAGDQGFFMHLSNYVAPLIKRHITSLTEPLLQGHTEIEACDWAIHPGGKSIVQAVERALNLTEQQTEASWKTLWNYGNMSSATFLFVLKQLIQEKKSTNPWVAGVGFGPGLSMEGILLQRGESSG